MDITFAQLADYANVSREGKLNLLGLFDAVQATKFPTVHPQMQLVIRFEVSKHELGRSHKVEIHFVEEDGKKILALGAEFAIQSPNPMGHRIHSDQIITITNLVIPKPGRYQFVIFIDNNLVRGKEITLHALERSHPQPPSQAQTK